MRSARLRSVSRRRGRSADGGRSGDRRVATDIEPIIRELRSFYDFTGRTVVDVGAGGGQLVEYARGARAVIAVDRDPAALDRLAARLRERGLSATFTLVARDFLDVTTAGDVVLLECCLHQMEEPERALAHARTLAPDVLVIDHAPGSPWSWHAAEDERVEGAWKAVERWGIGRERTASGMQLFR